MGATPSFDNWQFEGHVGIHAASEETELDYSDMQRCHTEFRSTFRARRWVPAFANSDRGLREVLASRMWCYVHGGAIRRAPERFVKNWKGLRRLVDAKVAQYRRKGCNFPAPVPVEIQAAICYRSWRLGQDSPTIAAALRLSPGMVRTTLFRIRVTAEKIGLPIGFSHHSKGQKWDMK